MRWPVWSVTGRMVRGRLIVAVPAMLCVSLVIVYLAKRSPYDPVTAYLGANSKRADSTTREAVAQLLHSDRSWLQQWWAWFSEAVTGNLGTSSVYQQPVVDAVAARLPWTLLLVGAGLAAAILVAFPVALISVRRPEGVVDRTLVNASRMLAATPGFVISLGLVGVFAVSARLLPAGGLTDPGAALSGTQVARHAVLPIAAMTCSQLPWLVLHLREALLTQLRSPAVSAARLRGLSDARVLVRHALPSSLLPTITLCGTRLPEVITGSVLIETVFSWPGLGQSIVNAATSADYALLTAITLLTMLVVLAGNLAADIGCAIADPRIRHDR